MNDERPIPKLDPDKLKSERHDVDLGDEEQARGHDAVHRQAGRPAGERDTDKPIAQPTAGVSPPAH